MKKLLLILCAVLLLASCGSPSPEPGTVKKLNMNDSIEVFEVWIPHSCCGSKMIYVARFKNTTTTTWTEQHGKLQSVETSVTIK